MNIIFSYLTENTIRVFVYLSMSFLYLQREQVNLHRVCHVQYVQ